MYMKVRGIDTLSGDIFYPFLRGIYSKRKASAPLGSKCFPFQLEGRLYVKLKDWMSNSVDPNETAHNEPSNLDLRFLQKHIIIAYGSERL